MTRYRQLRRLRAKPTSPPLIQYLGIGRLSYTFPSQYGLHLIEVTRVAIPIFHLDPRLSQLRLVQISDLHCDRKADLQRLAKAVAMINVMGADLILITGDYFTGPRQMERNLEACAGILSQLKPRHGIYSIFGNHDYWVDFRRLQTRLTGQGIRFINNESVLLACDGAFFYLVGLDSMKAGKINVARAFQKVNRPLPVILLAHHPDVALHVSHRTPHIMLCGHTHGSQMVFPRRGPVLDALKIGKRYIAGLNRFDNYYIYTNRGLGTFMISARLNCPPEITRIRLLPSSEYTRSTPLAGRDLLHDPRGSLGKTQRLSR